MPLVMLLDYMYKVYRCINMHNLRYPYLSLSTILPFVVKSDKLLVRMEKKISSARLKQYFSNPEKSAGGRVLSLENISPLELVLQFEDDTGEHSIILT